MQRSVTTALAGLTGTVMFIRCWGLVATAAGPVAPEFGYAQVTLAGNPAPFTSSAVCGFALIAAADGPQVAVMQPARAVVTSVAAREQVTLTIHVRNVIGPVTVTALVTAVSGGAAEAILSVSGAGQQRGISPNESLKISVTGEAGNSGVAIRMTTLAIGDEAALRWERFRLEAQGKSFDVPIVTPPVDDGRTPAALSPDLRQPIQQALIEWDWRMQDGLGTAREPASFAAAIQRTLSCGDKLLHDLCRAGVKLEDEEQRWEELRHEWSALSATPADEQAWEDLWRRVHKLRRSIALSNPLADLGPLLFVKQPPASFSHQLTQYIGRYARPGGGLFVLDEPGRSMRCRQLAAEALPLGSYQHPEVSYDGRSVLFAFCQTDSAPSPGIGGNAGRHFHLFQVASDGTGVRQLTDGPFDDFSPRYLPNGKIVFISTRRGGWHRCGGSPGHGCENYTLAIAEADGSHPHPISYHETQEWDPAVLADGRIVYTRWDYVDRHAVYYEQLWTARPDGTGPSILYGNNTFNPVGIWEARQVPGSSKIMATAAAHHAMTAGSIILVDATKAVDGPLAIDRLTPDALFPESETRVAPRAWHAPAGVGTPPPVPVEQRRWPGHCYKSPHPLSEDYFLASYSFDPLIGEPDANPVNMFGIYLVDRFGNKELLYRDLNIASMWPVPLRPRTRPPAVRSDRMHAARTHQSDRSLPTDPDESAYDRHCAKTGTFILQNVYESDPPLPPGSVKRLRIVQVLPKSTPGINWPRLGLANASPGKQVLGTVPVEADGSAHFRAPASVPLTLHALDEHGRAVQIMRSVTYLQPGEVVSCTGCHEPRNTTPPPSAVAQAVLRPPSRIEPSPDGSSPFSYPLLVQPVLDRHCVRCHNPEKPAGDVVLTGDVQGAFTVSYNTLAPRVTYSAWGGRAGDFRHVNSEPLSQPGFFGAVSSDLMNMLLEGHHEVVLGQEEIERLATWMDANALFYGTFNHGDQRRQQRGERINGPDFQ